MSILRRPRAGRLGIYASARAAIFGLADFYRGEGDFTEPGVDFAGFPRLSSAPPSGPCCEVLAIRPRRSKNVTTMFKSMTLALLLTLPATNWLVAADATPDTSTWRWNVSAVLRAQTQVGSLGPGPFVQEYERYQYNGVPDAGYRGSPP